MIYAARNIVFGGVHIHCCGNGHLWFSSYSQPFQGLRLKSPKTPVRVTKTMWAEVLARFEKKAPASVMVKLALEQAIPAEWVDQVFEEHRQRQYPRELLF
ncbi:hypothetical protein ACN1C3_30500, partial [Pseudomonas sp. H11T01]